jgi:hypothetical protein
MNLQLSSPQILIKLHVRQLCLCVVGLSLKIVMGLDILHFSYINITARKVHWLLIRFKNHIIYGPTRIYTVQLSVELSVRL